MKQYIDKVAVVAEINNWIQDARRRYTMSRVQFSLSDRIESLEKLVSFLDTLEVKEVDDKVDHKSTDNVEPKFKIEKDKCYVCIRDLYDNYGTRAFCKGNTYYSTKDETLLPDNSNVPFEIKYCVNDYFRPWSILDAKDGDVLAFNDNTIVIFKDLYNKTLFHSYCHIEDGALSINKLDCLDWWSAEGFKPATKEQRAFFFQKMKESGYEWLDIQKQLKITQIKEWSEEYGNRFKSLIC